MENISITLESLDIRLLGADKLPIDLSSALRLAIASNLDIAEAKAEAYRKIAEVIGENNAALIEIMKLVTENGIDITPDVMVGGGDGKMSDALMGTILRGKLGVADTTTVTK